MIILWTTNNMWGSRLIRWGFGDDCSHVAVQFGATVYESRLQDGVKSRGLSDFLSVNQVVHRKVITWSATDESIAECIVKTKQGSRYDTKALLWWAVCALGRRITGRVPAHNQWGDKDQFFCVEVLSGLEGMLGLPGSIDLQMERPHTLWQKLMLQ